ncbi:NEW3 domain-containing protein [Chloroflexus sp.]|uniref:COG1470 family protein n=1 Tax=Chloroflexus sp. TaxID=1904827 RepID=UPI002ACD3ABC|nr:NEW3 domain-containing protein [Chloroflexus sp.]
MRAFRIISLLVILALIAVVGAAPALAQENQRDLFFYTRYPAQEATVGDVVTVKLTLGTDTTPQIVRLGMREAPSGWNVTFRGDGRVIQAAYVEPNNNATFDLRIEPPSDVKAGSYRMVAVATGVNQEVVLPIELTLKAKTVNPAGLAFKVDLPTLRGSPSTTFRYNVTLKNESSEEVSVSLLAEAPRGFQVDFKLSGQSITSVPFGPNESKNLSVEVRALNTDVPAGTYEIGILARGGDLQATTRLVADITGQPQLLLTTPNGRLSGEARIGEKTDVKLIVRNTGSAPARNIELSASPPVGWTVEFEPKQIPELANGQLVEVTAKVQPSNQAIAGDYLVTFTARPAEAAVATSEFRFTVLTSTIWGLVGIALIAVAVVGVGVAVMRFGRR